MRFWRLFFWVVFIHIIIIIFLLFKIFLLLQPFVISKLIFKRSHTDRKERKAKLKFTDISSIKYIFSFLCLLSTSVVKMTNLHQKASELHLFLHTATRHLFSESSTLFASHYLCDLSDMFVGKTPTDFLLFSVKKFSILHFSYCFAVTILTVSLLNRQSTLTSYSRESKDRTINFNNGCSSVVIVEQKKTTLLVTLKITAVKMLHLTSEINLLKPSPFFYLHMHVQIFKSY